LERSRRVFADAEAESAASVGVEALALVDVDATAAAVDGLLVAGIAGALEGTPRVDAFVLAAVIAQLTFVNVPTIATVARRLKPRIAFACVRTWRIFTDGLGRADGDSIVQAFVEILALFGESVDAIAFRTNASITSRFVDTVLVREAFVTTVGAFVNVNAIRTRL